MLRAVGVPTRMVAGWAAGHYIPQARQFLILDSDRHGWTQVYYENYGWVDVEVTPGRVEPSKEFEVPELPEGGTAFDDDELLEFGDEIFDELDETLLEDLGLVPNFPPDIGFAQQSSQPTWLYILLGIIGGAVLLAAAVWTWLHWGLDPERRAYAKMVHFGKAIGMSKSPSQTAGEYARRLGFLVPPVHEAAVHIAGRYERVRYGNTETDPDDARELGRAWRRVLRGLLAYRVGLTGRRREGGTAEEMMQARGQVGAAATSEGS